MLRVLLVLVLVGVAGSLGFWFGKSGSKKDVVASRTRIEPVRQPNMATPAPQVEKRDTSPGVQLPQEGLPPAPGTDEAVAGPLLARRLAAPVANLKASDVRDTFYQERGGGERRHEASDIMAPRGTPVFAMDDGVIQKLFHSKPGGITIYLFDDLRQYCFYYAHLDRYANGLHEGQAVKRGQLIGYVGSTGNADLNAPHLHLAILELGPQKEWWQNNTPINPFPVLNALVGK